MKRKWNGASNIIISINVSAKHKVEFYPRLLCISFAHHCREDNEQSKFNILWALKDRRSREYTVLLVVKSYPRFAPHCHHETPLESAKEAPSGLTTSHQRLPVSNYAMMGFVIFVNYSENQDWIEHNITKEF